MANRATWMCDTLNARSHMMGLANKSGPADAPTSVDPDLTPHEELTMSIPADAAAHQETAIDYLRIAREKLDLATYDRIYWIGLARQYGATWKVIGESLGITDVAARRLHNRNNLAVKNG